MMVPEGRIVEKIIEAHKSNDLTPLIAWLEKLGCTDITRDQDSAYPYRIDGNEGGVYTGRSCHPCGLHRICPVRPPLGLYLPYPI